MVWAPHIKTKIIKRQIETLNRVACTLITGMKRSTPQKSLEIIIGLEPLLLHLEKVGLTSYIRQKTKIDDANWATKAGTSHITNWKNINIVDNNRYINNDICNEHITERIVDINLESFEGSEKHLARAQFTVYTDGSKIDNGTGSGFVVYHNKERIHTESISLPNHATVFQTEIMAINQACQYLLSISEDYNIKYLKIFSDSQAAILALHNTRITSLSVLETLEYIETLAHRVRRMTISWIKAQVNHEGNEAADMAAKEGAHAGRGIRKITTLRPWAQIKTDIDEYIRNRWKEQWIGDYRFKHSKLYMNGPNKAKSKGILKLNTITLTEVVAGITGHNNLAYFQAKLNPNIDPTCRLCNEGKETMYHLMTECKALSIQQLEILQNKYPTHDASWSIKQMVKFMHLPQVHNLLNNEISYEERETLYLEQNYTDEEVTD